MRGVKIIIRLSQVFLVAQFGRGLLTKVLIIESNTPAMNAVGGIACGGFLRTILGLRPATEVLVASPYGGKLRDQLFHEVDGVIFSGSGVAWSTDAPEAAGLRSAMEVAFAAERPVWGSCNGLQLAAVVLGGSVGASPKGHEVGLALDLALTEQGERHAMMSGRSGKFAVPCVHRDEVQRMPEGAVLLAANAHSQVQAMVYEKDGVDFWGTQYHPELSASEVGGYLNRGIFEDQRHMQHDLMAADFDPEAASRLGAPEGALSLEMRARELLNWLDHVEAKRAA